MALAFSAMVSRLSADERKLLDNTFAKYPDLKDEWVNLKEDGLRQAEFSRRMTEIDAKEKDFEKTKTRNETLEALNERNYTIWSGLVEKGIVADDGTETWTSQKAELEKQLDEAKKAAVGGDMDPAELDRRVKEIVKDAGVQLSKEEMALLIQNEGKKLAQETFDTNWTEKEKDFNEKTIPFVAGFSMSGGIVANHYEKETGEKWTSEKSKELFQLMSDKKNFDPLAVEEDFMKPHREKKSDSEKDAEIARLKAELNQRTMPGGGDEDFIPQSADQKGALQFMLDQSSGATDVETKIQEMAVKSAKELQAAR